MSKFVDEFETRLNHLDWEIGVTVVYRFYKDEEKDPLHQPCHEAELIAVLEGHGKDILAKLSCEQRKDLEEKAFEHGGKFL